MSAASFKTKLQAYKTLIDADITTYAAHVSQVTKAQYGPHPGVVTDAFLNMLDRGGKRLRGALTIIGYEMCGGTDRQMIVRAATAIEMVHAHILILDDIQDRSSMRRGQPTVHEMLAAYHRERKLPGDPAHTGVSLALNASMAGAHAAHMLIAGLGVAPELRSKADGIISLAVAVTAHGQTTDFMQELSGHATLDEIEHTMEWKTAHYTILNPLCVGMVLAGAGCEDTDAIRTYALHTGKAFQITDDILGIFGTDDTTGKSVMDDMREGKQTMLTVYALERAREPGKAFLRGCLGKKDLSTKEFTRCQDIIRDSGALAYAQNSAQAEVSAALAALRNPPKHWKAEQVTLLRDLAQSLGRREQ